MSADKDRLRVRVCCLRSQQVLFLDIHFSTDELAFWALSRESDARLRRKLNRLFIETFREVSNFDGGAYEAVARLTIPEEYKKNPKEQEPLLRDH